LHGNRFFLARDQGDDGDEIREYDFHGVTFQRLKIQIVPDNYVHQRVAG
jgi:hypothetical protein